MKVEELPQIFRDCVAKEGGRYSIEKPWVADGFVYATDGRIICRMPVPPGGIEGELASNPPKCLDLGWDVKWADAASPVPELTKDETKECQCCQGEGYHACCDHACDDCEGTGEILIINATPVGCVLLGNNYLRILAANGASVFMRADGNAERPVRFVGAGWDGLLMTRRGEK